MKFLVYKVVFPNSKIYIGITNKTLEKRKYNHYIKVKTNSNFKFHNALRKYQGQEIWEEFCFAFSWEDACELERKFILEFNSCQNGYNSTSGGEGNYNPCSEVLKKMSDWQKGIPKSEEHKKKLSEAKLGKKYKSRSEDSRLNIALSRGSKKFSVFNKDTNEFLGEWVNMSACARQLNIQPARIQKCLKYPEKYKRVKNYIFKLSAGGGLS